MSRLKKKGNLTDMPHPLRSLLAVRDTDRPAAAAERGPPNASKQGVAAAWGCVLSVQRGISQTLLNSRLFGSLPDPAKFMHFWIAPRPCVIQAFLVRSQTLRNSCISVFARGPCRKVIARDTDRPAAALDRGTSRGPK